MVHSNIFNLTQYLHGTFSLPASSPPSPPNLSSLLSSSLLLFFFISKIIKFFPFTGTNPLRRINYFTSGTELSHCEQHIAGINAHQLAKLCAFSKWVADFWGNRDSRRPLRDSSLVKFGSSRSQATLTMLRLRIVFHVEDLLNIKITSLCINLSSTSWNVIPLLNFYAIVQSCMALWCVYINFPSDMKAENT